MTVLSWRGTYSWPDFWMNGLWYGERFKYDLPEKSKARWIESKGFCFSNSSLFDFIYLFFPQ